MSFNVTLSVFQTLHYIGLCVAGILFQVNPGSDEFPRQNLEMGRQSDGRRRDRDDSDLFAAVEESLIRDGIIEERAQQV